MNGGFVIRCCFMLTSAPQNLEILEDCFDGCKNKGFNFYIENVWSARWERQDEDIVLAVYFLEWRDALFQ